MSLKETLTRYRNWMEEMNPRPTWAHGSYEGLVLAEGRTFFPAPLPSDVEPTEVNECFRNALMLAWGSYKRFTYCEGYGFAGVLPTMHAWVTDESGLAIDPTWSFCDGSQEYYGIEFPLEFVKETTARTGYYGLLGNDWLDDCRLLKLGSQAWMNPTFRSSIY